MMTSITARRTAVIDPSPHWLYREGCVCVWRERERKNPVEGRGWRRNCRAAERAGCREARLLRHGMNGETDRARERERERERETCSRYLIAGSTPQCSSTQTHNYSIESYYQTEREIEEERESDRAFPFGGTLHRAKECFYQSCDYCHSLSALNQLPCLSFLSLSVTHRVLAQSTRFVGVAEITGFTLEGGGAAVEPRWLQGNTSLCHDYSRLFSSDTVSGWITGEICTWTVTVERGRRASSDVIETLLYLYERWPVNSLCIQMQGQSQAHMEMTPCSISVFRWGQAGN